MLYKYILSFKSGSYNIYKTYIYNNISEIFDIKGLCKQIMKYT